MNVKASPQLESGIINNAKKCVFIRQRFFMYLFIFLSCYIHREKISLTIIKLESEIYHHTISHPTPTLIHVPKIQQQQQQLENVLEMLFCLIIG